MLEFYQHISERLNPTFSVGFFSVSWYSLMYIVGFFVVYMLLKYRIANGDFPKITNNKIQISNKLQIKNVKYQNRILLDCLIYIFIGLLVGARAGYVLFYDLRYFLENPLAVVSPFDAAGNFAGIYGMSYHGGLIGSILAAGIFARKYEINFWKMANFVAPAIPAGYFFGRIGNFLNGELYGRVTEKPWGMYFLDENGLPFSYLRHPSQLYEAILEGTVLFFILWYFRNKKKFRPNALAFYVIGYSLARIFCEFFRQPDSQIGYIFRYFTLGQFLSLGMFFFGVILLKKEIFWYNSKEVKNLSKK